MTNHDAVKDVAEFLDKDIKKVSTKFSELSLDLKEVMEQSKNPAFIAALLYKLAEEREKTNKLFEKISEQYDSIMLHLKTQNTPFNSQPQSQPHTQSEPTPLEVLPEQDQMILHLAQQRGQITAEEVKTELGYKGKNAASQRLNKLFREGQLRKIQSGRKVLYLARNQ